MEKLLRTCDKVYLAFREYYSDGGKGGELLDEMKEEVDKLRIRSAPGTSFKIKEKQTIEE